MSEIKQLPTRDEVPTPLTWDLTKIFKDDAAFDVDRRAKSSRII